MSDVVEELIALGIKGDLAARAAAATTGEPAHVAVAWIAKEAEKRARASGTASRASTPAGSSARKGTSVRSMRGGSCRASTPAGLRSNIEEWNFGSHATSMPDSLACLSPKDSERSNASTTSAHVVPWLRKSYPKFNFSQKREEPLAMASGLGTMPHRLMRQSPMSFDVTRTRFNRYGRQVEEFSTRRNDKSVSLSLGRSSRPKSAMSATAMEEIRNLKHEIDQLRMEMLTRSFPMPGNASVQSTGVQGRKKTGLLYGGRAYTSDFCD